MSPVLADFEHYPPGADLDETDINLRAYFTLMPAERLAQYDPSWTDDQLMEWESNFKNDGSLFLICSERDVEPADYRRVLELFLEFRKQLA